MEVNEHEKWICVLLSMAALLLASCGGGDIGGDVDVDLTKLSGTVAYSELYNITNSPSNYIGKTIVCGHWHASFGHSRYERKGPEFGKGADFSPYYAPGIIAIDACTATSGMVNCILLKDDEGGETK